jgi:hypothetical protein
LLLPYVVVRFALLLFAIAHLVLLLLALGCCYSPCVVVALLFIHVLTSLSFVMLLLAIVRLVLLLLVEVLHSPLLPCVGWSLEHLETELGEPEFRKRKKDTFFKTFFYSIVLLLS